MPKESVCIKVPKIHGEKTLVLVKRLEINDRELEINRDADSICVALVRQPEKNELAELAAQVPDFQLVTGVFQERNIKRKRLLRVSQMNYLRTVWQVCHEPWISLGT